MKKLMMVFTVLLAAPLYGMEGESSVPASSSFEAVGGDFLTLAAEPLDAEQEAAAAPTRGEETRVVNYKPVDLTKLFSPHDLARLVAAVDEKIIAYCTALLKAHGTDAVLFGPALTDMSREAETWRAALKDPATCCLLLHLGANPTPAARKGKSTALHVAALRGDHVIMAVLLGQMSPESIAACNGQGRTALHLAAREGDAKCVALLLLYMGFEHITLKDRFGYAACDLASSGRIKWLIASHLSKRGYGSPYKKDYYEKNNGAGAHRSSSITYGDAAGCYG